MDIKQSTLNSTELALFSLAKKNSKVQAYAAHKITKTLKPFEWVPKIKQQQLEYELQQSNLPRTSSHLTLIRACGRFPSAAYIV